MRYLFPLIFLFIGCTEASEEKEDTPSNTADESIATIEENANVLIDSTEASHDYLFHWETEFDEDEKSRMTTYVGAVRKGVEAYFGEYKFPVNVYFHKLESSEPIPWAHTVRSNEQGVHLHVDLSFSDEEFLKDWTAPHEISHLALPFVGRKNMWFSEGFATFMQHQVLLEMGTWTQQEVDDKFKRKFERHKDHYNSNKSITELSLELRSQGQYGALYWGGVSYFYYVDKLLAEKGVSFRSVLQAYQSELRLKDNSLLDVINSLDALSKTTVFSDLIKKYRNDEAREIFLLSTGFDPQAR